MDHLPILGHARLGNGVRPPQTSPVAYNTLNVRRESVQTPVSSVRASRRPETWRLALVGAGGSDPCRAIGAQPLPRSVSHKTRPLKPLKYTRNNEKERGSEFVLLVCEYVWTWVPFYSVDEFIMNPQGFLKDAIQQVVWLLQKSEFVLLVCEYVWTWVPFYSVDEFIMNPQGFLKDAIQQVVWLLQE
ncbi:hypothetical protein J6590_022505 [Homalodisca vitripennis]|nr:hypothetical protein J6590_022505 [Homalodisca vitripennis]